MIAAALMALLAFLIPIEHKYDKLFRFFSKTLVPSDLFVSKAYDKKIYFYISDLIALTLILFVPSLRRFIAHPIWIVLICAIGSILASPFAHYAIPYVRLLQLLSPLLLFSYLRTALTFEETEKLTRVVLIAIFTAGLFQAAIAITQYIHQAPLGLRVLGETATPSTFPTPYGPIMRAGGTLPHANIFGGFMLLSIFSTYLLFWQAHKKFLLLTLPFQFLALFASFSRSALFAFVLSHLVWFLMRGLKDKTVKIVSSIFLISLSVMAPFLYKQYVYRGGVVNYNEITQGSDQIRKNQHAVAFRVMKDRPLLGLGYAQFTERAQSYFSTDADIETRITAPHNIYLFIACETGLISMCAFLCMIGSILLSLFKAKKTPEITIFSSIFLGFLFIGCCDFYLILSQQGKLMFFLVAGLLAAHLNNRQQRTLDEQPISSRRLENV